MPLPLRVGKEDSVLCVRCTSSLFYTSLRAREARNLPRVSMITHHTQQPRGASRSSVLLYCLLGAHTTKFNTTPLGEAIFHLIVCVCVSPFCIDLNYCAFSLVDIYSCLWYIQSVLLKFCVLTLQFLKYSFLNKSHFSMIYNFVLNF